MPAKGAKKSVKPTGDAADKMEIDTEDNTNTPTAPDYAKLLRENLKILVRAVELDDKSLIRRVWRRNTPIRRHLSLADFQQILTETFPPGEILQRLLSFVDKCSAASEVSSHRIKQAVVEPHTETPTLEPLMEVESYLSHILSSWLIRVNLNADALSLCETLINRFKHVNRQTLDSFVGKMHAQLSLASERLNGPYHEESLLKQLLASHKTSSLRLYDQSKATLVNLILRKHILAKCYTQARVFLDATRETTDMEASNVSNTQQIRYLLYSAKIAAIGANYSESESHISRAMHKCPPSASLGIRLSIAKLSVVAKLLLGELPPRDLFSENADTILELKAYLSLVQSVRNGSIADYKKVTTQHKDQFQRDDLATLIARLRSSVLKAGLRNLNLAYSRISFTDIKTQLELGSDKDAELMCAKAIKDQIIEHAVIDVKAKALLSTETVDVYSTTLEPKQQFQKRVDFCIKIHNAAMRAHKHPPDSHMPKGKEEKEQNSDEEAVDDIIDELMDSM